MALALPLLALCLAGAQPGGGATPAPGAPVSEADFPYVIRVSTQAAKEAFGSGDRLAITTVRGDRKRIETGGTYLVQGTYVLASEAEAMLALNVTNGKSSGKNNHMKITQGSGTFSLATTLVESGDMHVSFYVSDPANPRSFHSQGGIYFENR